MTFAASSSTSARNLQLDVLRGVAILMVLVCHSAILRRPTWDAGIWRPCWSGVDLFFVVSGFLISGLLFSEYKRTGRILFRRFAMRRDLRIYPGFYAVVGITVAIRVVQHRQEIWYQLLHDILFIQSYFLGTWGHFWSLSVEEHFYILLPLLMFFLISNSVKNRNNPFSLIPVIFAVVALIILIVRLLTARYIPYSLQTHNFPTHLRLDSLFFGVVISYWYHFHQERFSNLVCRRRILIFCLSALCLSPLFIWGQYERWMYTFGFTSIYLGYGCLLVGFLGLRIHEAPKPALIGLSAVAYIGTFSYSIYLWHGFCSGMISAWLSASTAPVRVAVFYTSSIVIGIVAAKLIEIPALRLRERLFPSVVSAFTLLPATGDRQFGASCERAIAGVEPTIAD